MRGAESQQWAARDSDILALGAPAAHLADLELIDVPRAQLDANGASTHTSFRIEWLA